MPTTITSAGVTFTDTTTLTSANGVPSALKLTTARTINGVSFDGTGNITIPATSINGANVAKAWVNFDGTLATPSVTNRNYNVSSVTKHGTGEYTINFASALTNSDYSVSGNAKLQGTVGNSQESNYIQLNTLSSNGVRIYVTNGVSNNQRDSSIIAITVFGN
jgi:hypothetical protein